jgi:hypothetical protein
MVLLLLEPVALLVAIQRTWDEWPLRVAMHWRDQQ